MALHPKYSLGHSQFNDFLFAYVGEEKSGAPLTVLSALARLGLDPWAEAARLSDLTRDVAASALAATIAGLPEGNWKPSDSRSIAGRLVDHLPKHVSPPGNSPPSNSPRGNSPRGNSPRGIGIRDRMPAPETAQKWLLWIGFGVAILVFLSRLYGD